MTDILLTFNKDTKLDAKSILGSAILKDICEEFVNAQKKTDLGLYDLLIKTFGEKKTSGGLLSFIKRLYGEDYLKVKEEYMPLTEEKGTILNILDGIYDIWRKKERYAETDRKTAPITSAQFISLTDGFGEAIISCYRRIYENVLGSEQTVYRQLPSGVNAGLILNENAEMELPPELSFLGKTPEVESLLIRPPFICSSKENTRTGTFFEKPEPLKPERYNPSEYRAVALLIKGRVGYVFIKTDYLSFLVALGNLFRLVSFSEVKGLKPDFVIVFGADVDSPLTYYYKTSGLYVGLCPFKGHIAYFGYLKKIILTLHNLTMIDQGKLPIHGAGMAISLKNGKTYNVVILGDSGAGKSETLEAIKSLGQDEVSQITTIYDDMGTFVLRDGAVMTSGTETGAFVRLDDLDNGYSLKSVDRAIYINLDQVNSRVVIPIETYETSKELHKVDVFLLADNFTPDERGLVPFTDKDQAEAEFIKGARVAKGTTSEKGLVTSFFANPFGPVQREAECRPLIDMFFTKLFEEKTYVGKLYTKLALDPVHGPENGAQAMLNLLEKLG
jgi:energy-coupling factor transporter ATP-binding protein EcfA2